MAAARQAMINNSNQFPYNHPNEGFTLSEALICMCCNAKFAIALAPQADGTTTALARRISAGQGNEEWGELK